MKIGNSKNWKFEKFEKFEKLKIPEKKIQKLVLTENSEKIEFNFCTKKWISSAPYFWIFAPKKKTSTTNGIFAVKIQIKSNI